MQNLYLACRAYWADIRETNDGNLAVATRPEYGLIPSSGVAIEASGNLAAFSATAKHENSRTGKTFSINEKGEITELKK